VVAPRTRSDPKPADPAALRRETAGRYVSGDGRFTVQQSSGGWLIEDATQTNELGLPLVRGPFDTLDAARAAMTEAREGPVPSSPLAERIAAQRIAAQPRAPAGPAKRSGAATPSGSRTDTIARLEPEPPPPPPVVVREYRPSDGVGLRALWAQVDMHGLGDDDAGLGRMARRNPGLLLVATRGGTVVGSVLGGWDGRRGWLYHVAVAEAERRSGLATRLVRQVEDRLRALGAPKVNVIVRDGNADGAAFWDAAGYTVNRTRQFGKELGPDVSG
jgi:ribosomal protein S18 acetylase RimI-like enzyme